MAGMPDFTSDNNLAQPLMSITNAIMGMKWFLDGISRATQKQNPPKAIQNTERQRNSLSIDAAIVAVAPGMDAAPPMRSPKPVKIDTINIM